MPSPRKVMCVRLQPWPPFLPQTAGPRAPFFLTKTWRAPECSPGTLCLNDRHKSPAWAVWPNGRIRCATLPSLPLGSEMVRYCPPAKEKAVSFFFNSTMLQNQMHKSHQKIKKGLHKVQWVLNKADSCWNVNQNWRICLLQGKSYSAGLLFTLVPLIAHLITFLQSKQYLFWKWKCHVFLHFWKHG